LILVRPVLGRYNFFRAWQVFKPNFSPNCSILGASIGVTRSSLTHLNHIYTSQLISPPWLVSPVAARAAILVANDESNAVCPN
jgi:hypothetical protein